MSRQTNLAAYFWGRERIDVVAWTSSFSAMTVDGYAIPNYMLEVRSGEIRKCERLYRFPGLVRARFGPEPHLVYLFIPPWEDEQELQEWVTMDDLSYAVWEVVEGHTTSGRHA